MPLFVKTRTPPLFSSPTSISPSPLSSLPSFSLHLRAFKSLPPFFPPLPVMAALLVLLVLLSPVAPTSGATWCVCKSDVSDTALQKTLDYACGAGADCNPILQNGVCFQPNTVRVHCSYAANSFFQRKGQAAGSCDFAGTTTITTTDPSYSPCSYPSTFAGSSAAISTTSTSTTPTGFNNGILGGMRSSGNDLNTDGTTGMSGGMLLKSGRGSLLMSPILSGLVFMRDLF